MKSATFHTEPNLGVGIYTLRDVAFILNLPQKKVGRVLNEIWNKRFLPDGKEYSKGSGREKVVNFYTLIEYLDQRNKLLHLMTPNWQYSSLLKPFEKYIVRLDQKRNELRYPDFKRRNGSSKPRKAKTA